MAGKDRTGLVSALLLRLAGVSIEHVAADYAVSERNLLPLWQGWFDAASDERERRRRRRMAATPAAAMTAVLHELGGEAEYLRAAGVTSDQLDAVRARLRA